MNNRCKIVQLLFLSIALVCCSSIFSQNVEQIKSDNSYWSAEGIGTTIDEADKNALSRLIKQISVSITTQERSDNTDVRTSDGRGSHSNAYSESTSSFSLASLRNVEMIILEPEPNAKVFRWVSKQEVENMFKERQSKILDFIKTGKIAEQRLQIDDALRSYYWALILTKVHRDAVYVEFNGEEVNALTFLPMKIKSVISQVHAQVESWSSQDNRYYASMRFTYNNRNVASIQMRYFDGQSFIGPLVVRDGIGELELISEPTDGKIKLRYEYSFRNEAETLDMELRSIFSEISTPLIDNAMVEVPIEISKRKASADFNKKQKGVGTDNTIDAAIPPEPISNKKRLELATTNSDGLTYIMGQVENAIRCGTPRSVFSYFTPEGYKLFETLMTKTGKVSLVGKQQTYEFVCANQQILARFCKIKIKFKNGKTFMENLVFRFDESGKKIQSIAFALTKKAEDDIFNAASKWTEISRFTILQFMEDYQTAYSLKRLDYIEKIFSDDAIIITGTILKTAPPTQIEGMPINLGHNDVHFTRMSKAQYISKLRSHFNDREYIHLTFEDNQTKVINAPRIPEGTAFAIQINQMYNSPVYSDRGYLTLVLDASKELPIIHVRLWQPEKSNMMTLDEFMNKFEF